jgi:putative hydrolase of HD superfamily
VKKIADFLFEMGFLKATPRTGFAFLGSGVESVAEHGFGTVLAGYVLSRLAPGADARKVLIMCLFHDALEARTGDHNYVYKRYVKADEEKALRHLTENLPFGPEVVEVIREYEEGSSHEAQLAHDADQLDLLLSLKKQKDLGNPYAEAWIGHLLKRFQTEAGRATAKAVLESDQSDWWFKDHDHWWVNKRDNST